MIDLKSTLLTGAPSPATRRGPAPRSRGRGAGPDLDRHVPAETPPPAAMPPSSSSSPSSPPPFASPSNEQQLPQAFYAESFNALPMVIEAIHGSPAWAERGKGTVFDALESQVDEIVDKNHRGFNSCVSQFDGVLKGFRETEERVAAARRNVRGSLATLTRRRRDIRQLRFEQLEMAHTVRILETVERLAGLPRDIDRAMEDGRLVEAARLVDQLRTGLAGPDVADIKALSAVAECAVEQRQELKRSLCASIHTRIYDHDFMADAAGSPPISAMVMALRRLDPRHLSHLRSTLHNRLQSDVRALLGRAMDDAQGHVIILPTAAAAPTTATRGGGASHGSGAAAAAGAAPPAADLQRMEAFVELAARSLGGALERHIECCQAGVAAMPLDPGDGGEGEGKAADGAAGGGVGAAAVLAGAGGGPGVPPPPPPTMPTFSTQHEPETPESVRHWLRQVWHTMQGNFIGILRHLLDDEGISAVTVSQHMTPNTRTSEAGGRALVVDALGGGSGDRARDGAAGIFAGGGRRQPSPLSDGTAGRLGGWTFSSIAPRNPRGGREELRVQPPVAVTQFVLSDSKQWHDDVQDEEGDEESQEGTSGKEATQDSSFGRSPSGQGRGPSGGAYSTTTPTSASRRHHQEERQVVCPPSPWLALVALPRVVAFVAHVAEMLRTANFGGQGGREASGVVAQVLHQQRQDDVLAAGLFGHPLYAYVHSFVHDHFMTVVKTQAEGHCRAALADPAAFQVPVVGLGGALTLGRGPGGRGTLQGPVGGNSSSSSSSRRRVGSHGADGPHDQDEDDDVDDDVDGGDDAGDEGSHDKGHVLPCVARLYGDMAVLGADLGWHGACAPHWAAADPELLDDVVGALTGALDLFADACEDHIDRLTDGKACNDPSLQASFPAWRGGMAAAATDGAASTGFGSRRRNPVQGWLLRHVAKGLQLGPDSDSDSQQQLLQQQALAEDEAREVRRLQAMIPGDLWSEASLGALPEELFWGDGHQGPSSAVSLLAALHASLGWMVRQLSRRWLMTNDHVLAQRRRQRQQQQEKQQQEQGEDDAGGGGGTQQQIVIDPEVAASQILYDAILGLAVVADRCMELLHVEGSLQCILVLFSGREGDDEGDEDDGGDGGGFAERGAGVGDDKDADDHGLSAVDAAIPAGAAALASADAPRTDRLASHLRVLEETIRRHCGAAEWRAMSVSLRDGVSAAVHFYAQRTAAAPDVTRAYVDAVERVLGALGGVA